MLNYLKKKSNLTRTENGAVTNISTFSNCLDLFATIGAIRNNNTNDIIERFKKAFIEDKLLALKILFYGRDIRGGLGERNVFRIITKWLANNYTDIMNKNIKLISEFGRYDDLLVFLNTPCQNTVIEIIKNQLNNDIENDKNNKDISLLAKWLPSINTSNQDAKNNAKLISKLLNYSHKEYRQILSKLRKRINIIENHLRERDYTFDYSIQPSKAMHKYIDAFIRNDNGRYQAFLESVRKGEKTLKTGALVPYEIIRPIINNHSYYNKKSFTTDEINALQTTWDSLEDFTRNENAICVIDGSGSMYGSCGRSVIPATVALSLGIYFAERNKGAFKNHFITFSSKPRLVEIKGENIVEKVQYCEKYNEVADTNIQAVFELILNTALKYNVPQKEMPSAIYIISDMEFNTCNINGSISNFEYAKKIFEDNGYILPKLIFWNVESRNIQQPITVDDTGTILVSGCTPRIFSMVMDNDIDPYKFMLKIINSERYSQIQV